MVLSLAITLEGAIIEVFLIQLQVTSNTSSHLLCTYSTDFEHKATQRKQLSFFFVMTFERRVDIGEN